jgi:hypothetical protein
MEVAMANRISRYFGSSGFKLKRANQLAAHLEKAIYAFLISRGESPDTPSRQAMADVTVALDMVLAAHCAASVAIEGFSDAIIDDVLDELSNATRQQANAIVLEVINHHVSDTN